MLRYAITDRVRASASGSSPEEALLQQARTLAESGVDFIQLREKDLEAGALASLTRKLLAVLGVSAKPPKLLVNSRADVAVAAGADGVHLTSATGSLTPADIRQLYASAGLAEPVVSVSCHTLSDIRPACAAAADLILFGPVFEKVVTERVVAEKVVAEKVVATGSAAAPSSALIAEGIGLNLLHLACTVAAPTPVLALGGITEENTSATLAAGAAGIAAIRLFQRDNLETE